MGLQIEAFLNRGPIGTARRAVVQPFVDMLEPYRIWQQFGRDDIYPQELKAAILDWQHPSLTGRCKVLGMLKAIGPEAHQAFVDLTGPSALEEFQDNFDPEMGGYRNSNIKRLGAKIPPSIYATEGTVNVARHLANTQDGQPLGYATAVALLGQERVDRVIDFVRQSQDQLGGFHHNPVSITLDKFDLGRPSIWNTERALSVLWNLEQENHGIDLVREFLQACLVTVPTGEVGFRESTIASSSPSSEATMSALNILEMTGDSGWIQEHRSELVSFLKSCWKVDKKGSGGFGHTPGSEPTLLYTNAVLSVLDILGVDVNDLLPDGESRQQLIQLYTQHCKSREQERVLFGFAPGWAPNSHVMRETMYTLKKLAERYQDFRKLYHTIFGDGERVVKGIYAFVRFPQNTREEIGQ